METATFVVGGMSCGNCVAKLSGALESVNGVSSVEVEVGLAKVNHDGAETSEIEGAITASGFTVGNDLIGEMEPYGNSLLTTQNGALSVVQLVIWAPSHIPIRLD